MVLSGWKLFLNRATLMPQRYILGLMGMLALTNSFTMRVTLNMSITQMVRKGPVSERIVNEICPDPISTAVIPDSVSNVTAIDLNDENLFDWSEATQGFLLSSFYYGFVASHAPAGMLSEKYGGKWVIGFGMLLTALATLAIPLVVKATGAAGLIVMRIFQGIGEGTVSPAYMTLLASWIPPAERSRFGGLSFGGANIGNILGPIISGLIMADGGKWQNTFYFFGVCGILWFLFWIMLCYESPNVHPYISDSEKKFLNENVTASGLNKKYPVPYKALLRSVPLWVLVMAFVGYCFGYYAMLTDLPKYFSDVLKFNIKETGFLAALPYMALYLSSLILGLLSDIGVKRKWHSIGTARKLYGTICLTIPVTFMIFASYSGCDRVKAVAYFVAAVGFMGSYYISVKINIMDLAPNYSATCASLCNGIAGVVGIIVPYMAGLLTPDQTISQWSLVFWLVFAISIGSNVIFLIWGSGEQQWWDDIDKFGYPLYWKHGPLESKETQYEDSKKENKV